MIGAMLCYGLVSLGDNLASGLRGLFNILVGQQSLDTLGLIHAFALSAAALLTCHLVFTLWLSYFRIVRQRRRHRDLHLRITVDRELTIVEAEAASEAVPYPGFCELAGHFQFHLT